MKLIRDLINYLTGKQAIVLEPVKKRAPLKYPLGTVTNHYRKIVGRLNPGDGAVIPVAHYDAAMLQRSISSFAVRNWGCKAANVTLGFDRSIVIVRRLK